MKPSTLKLLFRRRTEDKHIFDHEPAKFLVQNVGLLPEGRVLDVATGGGRNAVYLAKLGFEVEGVDASSEAIETARKWAIENKVSIGFQTADLEKSYQITPSGYEAIICFYYLQRSLIPQIKAGLRTGGVIIYEAFIIDQRQFGHPRNPDFLLDYNELLNLFREFRCLRYGEGIIEPGKAIASLVAQKV